MRFAGLVLGAVILVASSGLAGADEAYPSRPITLVAGLASPEAHALAHTEAVGWLAPYYALAAQEYVARLTKNAAALRALGAPTLLALPNQMERAVFEAYAEFRLRRRV